MTSENDSEWPSHWKNVSVAADSGTLNEFIEAVEGINDINADFRGNSVLGMALLSDDVDKIKHALARGADPNRLTSRGISHMTLAAGHDKKILRLMLEHGGDPNLKQKNGLSPLQWAAFCKNTADNIVLLAESGAEINYVDNDGFSALTQAVENSNTDNVQVLLELGADPNVKDACGISIIDRASSTEITRILQAWA